MITEDYISFKTAKLLKENGFDANTLMVYSQNGNFMPNGAVEDTYQVFYAAPTLQMAMKFLRGKDCVIYVIPLSFYGGEKVSSWGYNIWVGDNLEVDEDNTPKFDTYEEACETAIKYCLENLI